MCGVFGMSGHQEAARMTYFGLYAQQHRGQESAGIVAWDGKVMRDFHALGLVHDTVSEQHLHELQGSAAIGHVSSVGGGTLRSAEPFLIHHGELAMTLAMNGSLHNAPALRKELENSGSVLQTYTDAELLLHLIVRNLKNMDLPEAVRQSCNTVRGAYSFVLLVNDTLIAVRDPHGFRPLCLGTVGEAHVVSSESCAFDLLEAQLLRSVAPGEVLVISQGKLSSVYLLDSPQPRKRCMFELIYFARPDSIIFDNTVYLARKAMGAQTAKEAPVTADFVMPFPDSGVYSAVGFAQAAGLPYEHAMIRNHYVGRTFIQPTQDMRDFSVRVKINPVAAMIKDKRICIVDDSIVRGTTMRVRVQKLRNLGAKEVHCRIACPPVKFPCRYGVQFANRGDLIAATQSTEQIRKILELDSLSYISLEGLLAATHGADVSCTACFDGNYPV